MAKKKRQKKPEWFVRQYTPVETRQDRKLVHEQIMRLSSDPSIRDVEVSDNGGVFTVEGESYNGRTYTFNSQGILVLKDQQNEERKDGPKEDGPKKSDLGVDTKNDGDKIDHRLDDKPTDEELDERLREEMAKQRPYTVKIFSKFQGKCSSCDKTVARGDEVYWHNFEKTVRCLKCGPHPGIRIRKSRACKAREEGVQGEREIERQEQGQEEEQTQEQEQKVVEMEAPKKKSGYELPEVDENSHEALPAILHRVRLGFKNVYLCGPAGTGKSTLAEHLSNELGIDFGFLSLSAGISETHLFGRIVPQEDGSWSFQESNFIRVFRDGGVFLLDEIDAADANVMVAINAALANGKLSNPVNGEIYERHENTIIVCAANTWGTGPDAQYVGRNALDAATLDRFTGATFEVNYSAKVEMRIAQNHPSFLNWMRKTREAIATNYLQRIASTRMLIAGVRLLDAGFSEEETVTELVGKWSVDERNLVPAHGAFKVAA